MKPEIIYLQLGGLLEILGIVTLITNENTILPHVDLGFEIPALLLSANIQGIGLFLAGSALTLYAVNMMR